MLEGRWKRDLQELTALSKMMQEDRPDGTVASFLAHGINQFCQFSQFSFFMMRDWRFEDMSTRQPWAKLRITWAAYFVASLVILEIWMRFFNYYSQEEWDKIWDKKASELKLCVIDTALSLIVLKDLSAVVFALLGLYSWVLVSLSIFR